MSKFIRELGKIAVPVTLQSMLQASFSIVDQIMIGQLGAVSIAAVGLGGNYSMIFNVVSGSVGTVAGILIAQFLGAGDKKEAWSSLTLSTVISLCLAGVFLVGVGVALEVVAGVVTLAGEGFVLAVCRVTPFPFGNLKVAFDVLLVGVASLLSLLCLHGLYGVREGTLAAALGVGLIAKRLQPPLQAWFTKRLP